MARAIHAYDCPALIQIYVIGDSRDPNVIVDAIADGARVGRTL